MPGMMMGMMGNNFYRGILLGYLLRELKSNNHDHKPEVHIIKQQDHHHQLDIKCPHSTPHYSHGYR